LGWGLGGWCGVKDKERFEVGRWGWGVWEIGGGGGRRV